MGINVALESTTGKREKIVVDPHGVLERFLPEPSDTTTSCLRFIDRYSDTVFNTRQVEVFLMEWEEVKGKAKTEEEKVFWIEVKELALECIEDPHFVLKFIGD